MQDMNLGVFCFWLGLFSVVVICLIELVRFLRQKIKNNQKEENR